MGTLKVESGRAGMAMSDKRKGHSTDGSLMPPVISRTSPQVRLQTGQNAMAGQGNSSRVYSRHNGKKK